MLIDKILEEWEKDSPIDSSNLGKESQDIPQLHAKYLKFLTDEKRETYKAKLRLNELKSLKYDYFTGRMSTEKLKELGQRPFPHKVLKGDVDRYMAADKELQKLEQQLEEVQLKVSTLEEILNSINRRSFHINGALEWLKFSNGLV